MREQQTRRIQCWRRGRDPHICPDFLDGRLGRSFFVHDYPSLALCVAGGFLILLISYYVAESSTTKHFGITSELSAFATFFIGVLVVIDIIPLQITIAIFVMLVFVMSLKSRTTQLMAGISKHEVQAFIMAFTECKKLE